MQFLNREAELGRLVALGERGGFGVVYGRRRVGKTRLLVEWLGACSKGLYFVADLSAPDIQRRYFAEAVEQVFAGFAAVDYPDWRTLLTRLTREARADRWPGPLVIDELPYLVQATPELPSVLQRWLDHEAGELSVVVAGSSQTMMEGLVLDVAAPLYGRAHALMEIQPLSARHVRAAFGTTEPRAAVERFAAWGGVPRYWELAAEVGGSVADQVDELVLDPLGPLHREPDRLIAEELPPAGEVRPLLDAIGGGAHRVSEIAGRIGKPATSLARPLARLRSMGLATREIPFGESERSSKRSVYRLSDTFTRLWFRVVAPHRGRLATSSPSERKQLFERHWPGLLAQSWEGLCRDLLPSLGAETGLGQLGPWGPGGRWWRGNDPEWDVVASSLDGSRLLLGEVKWSARVEAESRRLVQRPLPALPGGVGGWEVVRALFVADPDDSTPVDGVVLVTPRDLLD